MQGQVRKVIQAVDSTNLVKKSFAQDAKALIVKSGYDPMQL
jgi:hypothetical protein